MALAAEIGSVAQLAAFPLAGAGAAYRGIPMLDPRRQLPSGGFGLRGSWRAIWGDLRAGLPATYAGNPLMDTIGLTGTLGSPDATGPTVTILPGSRADAYTNLQPLLHLCAAVASRVQANFLCALASSIDVDRARTSVEAAGWQATGDLLKREGATVRLTRAFGDAVQAADVVVGLAGTANEQAAGLGKPVVTFAGPGSQITPHFVRLQKRLLGEALVTGQTWEDAANSVIRLLNDPKERAARGTAGRERMGGTGGVARIAETILALLRER